MRDNHILSLSDEYAFPNGPTLRPPIPLHGPRQVGIHPNELCLAYMVV